MVRTSPAIFLHLPPCFEASANGQSKAGQSLDNET